jgi:hypothetical protein
MGAACLLLFFPFLFHCHFFGALSIFLGQAWAEGKIRLYGMAYSPYKTRRETLIMHLL